MAVLAGSVFAMLVLAPVGSATGTSCAQAVLRDWRGGHIGSHYAPSCYRAVLASLPEDMLVYSSAEQDIERALHARLAALAARRPTSKPAAGGRVLAAEIDTRSNTRADGRNQQTTTALAAAQLAGARSFPEPVLVVGAAALFLVALGSAAHVAHKLRR